LIGSPEKTYYAIQRTNDRIFVTACEPERDAIIELIK
jgi:hypothetical protein